MSAASASASDTPWELALERALLRQVPARWSDDDNNDYGDGDGDDADRRRDRAEQLDEIMALAAIFGDDLSGPAAAVAAREAALVAGEDPPSLGPDADDDAAAADAAAAGGLLRFDLDVALSDADAIEGVPVRVFVPGASPDSPPPVVTSLPPVRLSVIFPEGYPSRVGPAFALTASWLSRAHLDAAARALDAVCAEIPGEVVIFALVEWLRERAVEETWCPGGELRLAPPHARGWRGDEPREDGDGDGDGTLLGCRGVPTSRGPEEAVDVLLRNDALARARRAAVATSTCGVCFSDVLGRDLRACAPGVCAHAFCATCVGEMARVHVTEGTIAALRCPEPGCGAALAPSTLRAALPEPLYERWERLTLERSLDSMADLTYCPRCETAVIEDEGDDHCARCTSCAFAFCSLCREGWHPGMTCLTPERRIEVLRARGAGDAAAGDEARRKHREQMADAMAQRYIEREGKRCPKCGQGVVKSEGCNKMHCVGCDGYFCYVCGDAIIGYEHFREGRCSLFDLEAIEAWEQQMNANFVAAEARQRDAYVAGLDARLTRCPGCRQQNYKLGNNNHVRCWSCNQHFCYACRKVVRRGTETTAHYGAGPGKCRQHSAD